MRKIAAACFLQLQKGSEQNSLPHHRAKASVAHGMIHLPQCFCLRGVCTETDSVKAAEVQRCFAQRNAFINIGADGKRVKAGGKNMRAAPLQSPRRVSGLRVLGCQNADAQRCRVDFGAA